jgi:hypothetical protein
MIIETGLGSPADMESTEHISLAPGENVAEFRPVVYLLILHLFYRGSRYDQTVKSLIFEFLKSIVKLLQMGDRCVE